MKFDWYENKNILRFQSPWSTIYQNNQTTIWGNDVTVSQYSYIASIPPQGYKQDIFSWNNTYTVSQFSFYLLGKLGVICSVR